MKAILLLAALGLVSILGTAKVLGRSRIPGIRLLVRTGVLFMLLGAVVGHNGLDLFDQASFDKLGPLVVIGLGWLGFFFGTNLEFKTLRKFPSKLYWAAFLQAVVAFVVVFLGFLLALPYLGLNNTSGYVVATIMAATAAGTAPSSLFMLGSERLVEGPRYESLRFFASIDDVPGLLALGVLFSFNPALHQSGIRQPIFWFLLQIALGVAFGFFLNALKIQDVEEAPGDLLVFGVIGMSSGLCLYLHLSPLFVSAITGFVAVNVSEYSEGIYERVSRREHAFYVLFLLLSGCLWEISTVGLPILVALYVGLRFLGKLTGTFVSSKTTPPEFGVSATSGLGLTGQGGLAVAMAVSYRWAFDTHFVSWGLSVVLLAVVIHELLAPWIELKHFRRVGEA